MKIKKVVVHKMFENFQDFPITQYLGVFDRDLLIRLFNNDNQELKQLEDSQQWELVATGDVYFVEKDYEFFS